MKKLLLKLVYFLLLLVITISGMYFFTGLLTKNHRLGTTYIKQKRLASIDGNKIVLLGGSNLHYGVNSQLMEENLGLNVVNMGIQGSIGLVYYFEEVIDKIKKDDVVILLAEPGHYYKLFSNGEQALYTLISKYPKGLSYLNVSQFRAFPNHIGVSINENLDYLLMLLAMKFKNNKTIFENTNQWGDYVGHKGREGNYSPTVSNKSEDLAVVSRNIDSNLALINAMKKIINSKNAHFFIGFAPTAKSAEKKELFQMIDGKITEKFRDDKLGNIFEYVLPDNYFFDTSHHLLFSYRDMRTRLLIKNMTNNYKAAQIVARK